MLANNPTMEFREHNADEFMTNKIDKVKKHTSNPHNEDTTISSSEKNISPESVTSGQDNASISPSSGQQAKVELRMDEITSKFKNAFERMAELESLQLSMENDTDDDIKRSWPSTRSDDREFKKYHKTSVVEECAGLKSDSLNCDAGVLVTAKEERLSPVAAIIPVKIRHTTTSANDFDGHNDTREDGNENSLPSEWSYEEQFKKLYELGDEADRKDFLDKLFAFMQQRGTPVNRVPIMAKQTLDLYLLFKLVVERGGLVEVINKKIWRGIIKGLNLPSSVTSAAFTLRTQYMKYIYPYECFTLKLSTPSELQCAIDGNRRDTARRPSVGHYTSMIEPEHTFYSNSTSPKSNCSSPTLKRTSSPTLVQSLPLRLPNQTEFVSPSFHGNNGIGFNPSLQRIVSTSSDSRTYKHDLCSKPSNYVHMDRPLLYEPPCKKTIPNDDYDKQFKFPHASWANIKIRMSGREVSDIHENGEVTSPSHPEENNGTMPSNTSPKQSPVTSFDQINENSMVVCIELNGIKYQGVLYAQRRQ